MVVPGYSHFGGVHPEVAALANVLIQRGVVIPHDGMPFNEELLIGIGGGLGGGYWVFEFGGIPPAVAIGARNDWQFGPGIFAAKIARRLGAVVDVHETTGPKSAAQRLHEVIASGRPAIVAADQASLPYALLPPELIKYIYHTIVVVGLDDAAGTAEIDDIAPGPLTVTQPELAAARQGITTMKHRLVTIDPPDTPIDLLAAVEAGLRECAEGLLNPPIRNFGLASFEKWADLVANRRNKKGWPAVFARDSHLYSGLLSVYRQIELNGAGGGLMRDTYATFLDQAATITALPALADLGDQYRALAAQWHALADTVLPADVPLLGETRELVNRREAVFASQGRASDDERRAIDLRLKEIEAAAPADFPLSPAEVQQLYDSMAEQLHALYAAEVEAAEALQATMVV
jgi:hypothetical protein